ncbi:MULTISPECIES: geranyl diphosphate 2-C-methyltransferase [Nocardiopsis]|uniref:Methyltransferase type 11 n=1 Tax=Nocardiopsis dassonvillei (strain ATCC 23218 / DSM 43111 / CIP 107115 / JCM 7437 / KCTC 9190 / NBRC 14626 / NCTC 10488 / NRRL B-5397 / IMRU 509) TaxID=446468 RepID=D7AYM4_NOCDD|nr:MULTISPECIES: geranyl diphosphate 2-C-methyltransferase [Nocardiopsis]ADH68036.1 Methyltransferase type 11 [Nocardiopsis dassonvillei subsp. dassonvillei DSM 43111]APC36180.1 SAM-dependent methyltransferase [Nocardiopsis dassonvillei]ASU59093.1 SAM-dependent methyltransferase [Nocardiopsis dassonvillei]NKY81452.1 methyltransferase domain-containing protein [Nocardiopsis dassonvillei]VEI88535.1 Geranyl diphosphate 2-C-methyltransferase [Nocardiopsis dassonvillei]
MTETLSRSSDVLRTAYQESVAAYWNAEKDPVNIRLGEVDGLYHHHYGVGDYDPSVLEGPEETRDERIIQEMHRLETAQANVLLDYLGPVAPGDRIMDTGSGRGGTSFMANQRFGCHVDGISISEQQVAFANAQAEERGVSDRVRFHFRNMLDTGFETGSLRASWNNESTMYVDLFELFREHARLLEYGGRYVTITGCYNDVTGGRSKAVSRIDEHYTCNIHPRSEYFRAMAANGLVPMEVVDLTAATIPYWELRAKSSVATGIEEPFLTAYKENSFHYLLIAADRV